MARHAHQQRLTSIVRVARRGWLALVLVLLVGLVAVSGVVRLQRHAATHFEHVAILTEMHTLSYNLDGYIWEGYTNPDFLDRAVFYAAEDAATLGGLAADIGSGPAARDLRSELDAYVSAMEQFYEALALGQVAEAERLLEEELTARFASLDVMISSAIIEHQRDGQRAARVADWGAPAIFVLASLVIGVLYWRYDLSRNVAARSDAEQRVARRFQALDQYGSDVITIIDAQNVIQFVSSSVSRVLGYEPDELIGRSVFERMHPDDAARIQDAQRSQSQMLRRGQPFEYRYQHRDGSWRHLESSANNLLDDPDVQGIVITTRDITERKLINDRLRETEARYRLLIEQIPAVTYIDAIDAASTTLFISPQFEALTGYTVQEVLSPDYDWLGLVHPDDREQVRAEHLRTNATGEPFRCEYRQRCKDGRYIWLRDEATIVYDPEGRPSYWHGVQYDVTEQKLAEARLRAAEGRYRTLVEQVPAITYIETLPSETEPASLYVSPQIEAILGYTPDEFQSESHMWLDLLHPADRAAVTAELERTDTTGEKFDEEYRIRHKDGRYVWIHTVGEVVHDALGEPRYWHGVMMDITERKEAEQALRDAEARYRTLVEQMPAVTYIQSFEPGLPVLYRSPQIEMLLGYPLEVFQRDPHFWSSVVHPEDQERVSAEIDRAAKRREPMTIDYRFVAADGRVVWVHDESRVVTDADGRPLYWQGVMLDITERKRLEEQLAHDAYHDALTGLPNRMLFLDRLQDAMAHDDHASASVAVVFLDLDNFKIVNDSLGHDLGDQLLVAVASRLRDSLRQHDLIARLGGDEFTVLIDDVASPAEVVRVVDRIHDVLAAPFNLPGHADQEIYITASTGIALRSSSHQRPEDLLREADLAMYQAKFGGRARTAVYEPGMSAGIAGRLELDTDMRRGIERGEFIVYYQPEVRIGDGELVGIEALVRWLHPQRGLVSPADFIPIAEETGLILPIGEHVLRESCRQLRAWQARHPAAAQLMVSVNLSPRQFRQPDLVARVAAVLADTGLAPGCLALEITESLAMDDVDASSRTLRELAVLGVQIMIDDFGTGHSSLAYLKRFPVSWLKVDRSFVDGLGSDLDSSSIVAAMIGLAHQLNLRVVAEGVETREQRAHLEDLGCDLAQGFLFSRPVPADALERWLHSRVPLAAIGGRTATLASD